MVKIQPKNLRVYGVLLRAETVLMSGENLGRRKVLKFPGGAVEPGETPETALRREFIEEGNLAVTPAYLLHVPGTLFSPWTHSEYTPMYFRVLSAYSYINNNSQDLMVEAIVVVRNVRNSKIKK